MTQRPRVPIALREMIFLICRIEPFCYLGRACYSLISKIVANKLSYFCPSSEVYLRGKEASKSIPGLSDLDYWIFLPETELEKSKILLELRILFRKLKNIFILPVKLEVTSSAGWNLSQSISPASFMQDIPLIKFTLSGWLKQNTAVQIAPRALSRFNLCFFEYKSAQLCLSNLTGNITYCQAVFNKHIKKLAEFSDLNIPFLEGSILQLQAQALIIMDRLSSIAALEVNNHSGLYINATTDKAERSDLTKYDFLNHFTDFKVGYDHVMDLLIWNVEQPDSKSAEQIFSIFENIPKDKRPLFIVTRGIWQCLWRGLAFGPLLENLDRIPSDLYKNQIFLASDIYFRIKDRLVTRINHNLGVLVSYNQSEFLAPILYQCFEILVVHSRQITNDFNLLCSISEKDCPLTVKWIRRLTSEDIPKGLQEWSVAFIEVRREALKVIESLHKH
jgi:hypothetical protein